MYQLTLIAALIFSTIAYSNDVENKLSCDIDKVQTKDWSADLAGYQQDNYKVIFPKWLSKANSGDPKYQFYVAKAYHMGDGITKDLDKAKHWYLLSLEQNYAPSSNNLAIMYQYNEGGPKVQNCLNSSVWNNCFGTKTYYGGANYTGEWKDKHFHGQGMYTYSDGSIKRGIWENGLFLISKKAKYLKILPDTDTAFNLMCDSAQSGFHLAQFNMGSYYDYGLPGVITNGISALSWYKIASENGNVAAMNGMSYMYRYGVGIEIDLEESTIWAKKAANKGSYAAMYNLGLAYTEGNGVEIDDEIAFDWFYKAAIISPNDSYAYTKLGQRYWGGIGVKRDLSEAAFWFYKAANLNDQLGIDSLALVFGDMNFDEIKVYPYINIDYIYDEIAPRLDADRIGTLANGLYFNHNDITNALVFYKLAAHKGDVRSQSMLGYLLSRSTAKEIKIDYEHAEYWYKKAIENGDIDSIAWLGTMYIFEYDTLGVKNILYDPKKGFELLQESADKGSTAGLDALAYAYEDGVGIDKNISKAIELLQSIRDNHNTKRAKKDELLLEIVELQINNNMQISDEFKEHLKRIKEIASNGDTKSQLLLGTFYANNITRGFQFNNATHTDLSESEYWLKKASNASIEANIMLSRLYVGAYGDIGYVSMEKAAKSNAKALELFENESAFDYDFFKTHNQEDVVHMYHASARMFEQQGMNDLAEQMLRKASSYYLGLGSKKNFEFSRKTIMQSLTKEGDIENYYIEIINDDSQNWTENLQAIVGLAEIYNKNGEYTKSIKTLKDNLDKATSGEVDYSTILLLMIAESYLKEGDIAKSKNYLEHYSSYKEEQKNKEVNSFSFLNTIESAMLNLTWGDIYLQEKNFKRGIEHIQIATKSLTNAKSGVNYIALESVLPIMRLIVNEGFYKEAFETAKPLLELYKQSYKDRIENNIKITSREKNSIKDVIGTYIYAAQKSDNTLPGLGFEVMQLSSGLTVSDAVIRATVKKQLDKQATIFFEQLDSLNKQKDLLLNNKYNNYVEMSELDTIKINNDLDDLDAEINIVNNNIKESKSRIDPINLFINSVEDIQNVISVKDALLTMLISSDRTFVWLVTSDGVYSNNVAINSSDIKENVQDLLTSLDPKSGINTDFPFKSSSALYDLLIRPFEKQLEGIDRLIIAPDSVVSKIPFSVLTYNSTNKSVSGIGLVDNVTTRGINQIYQSTSKNKKGISGGKYNWLIDKFALSIIPSVHSYVELEKYKKTSQNNFNNFIGIGNPILSGTNKQINKQQIVASVDIRGSVSDSINELSQLPETEDELSIIAGSFPESYLLLGVDATEKNLRSINLDKYSVVSFATHALVSEEIEDIVEPSLVLTQVDISDTDNDGLLTASEIMQLKFDAEIVLLSACNTASPFGESNTQGLSGLANSFFSSGAKSLLVSYWSVISESAVDVTTRIFRPANRGRSYAHKHRNAVIDILKDSAGTFRSHPSYWAPFSVIGVQ